MTFEHTFTSWISWERRAELSGLRAPGVYAIAEASDDMSGKPFLWPSEVIYFGVSGNLKNRLRQFDNTISQKRKEHGGADRVLFKHPEYAKLLPHLYVAVLSIGTEAAEDTPECWRRIGEARKAEYYCIAEYLQRHGQLPEFNRPDSVKFSRSSAES